MDGQDKATLRRRGFFRLFAVGGLTAATGALPFGINAVADTESYDEKRKPRYRETEEVKTYYRVNSYPASAKR
jgi:hypothetical protein